MVMVTELLAEMLLYNPALTGLEARTGFDQTT
jgi:hypothetical protein